MSLIDSHSPTSDRQSEIRTSRMRPTPVKVEESPSGGSQGSDEGAEAMELARLRVRPRPHPRAARLTCVPPQASSERLAWQRDHVKKLASAIEWRDRTIAELRAALEQTRAKVRRVGRRRPHHRPCALISRCMRAA